MSTPVTYTAATAAAATGLSPEAIKRAVKAGHLKAKVSGGFHPETGKPLGKYLIAPADLQAWFDGLADA